MPELDVQWILPDGAGGGSREEDDGTERLVRVPGSLPGDRVAYEVTSRSARLEHGHLTDLLEPSSFRREPPCRWNDACGRCDLSSLDETARHRELVAMVRRAWNLEHDPELVHASNPGGYRARIRLRVRKGALGYRAARGNSLVEVERCGVARREVASTFRKLRHWVSSDPGRLTGLRGVELRSDGRRVVYEFTSDPHITMPAKVWNSLEALGDVAIDGEPLYGDPVLWLELWGVQVRVSPGVSFPANPDVNNMLVGHVTRVVEQYAPGRVLDLCAGIGSFSLPLASGGMAVAAVDRDRQALDDIRASAQKAGVSGRVHTVAEALERFRPATERFDVAVLDMPNTGCDGALPALCRKHPPKAVVHITENIVAGGPDVAEAVEQGFRVADVTLFDVYPDTHRIVVCTTLERA